MNTVKYNNPLLLVTLIAFLSIPFTSFAQYRNAGDVGIGLQIGQPSGLSIGVYQPRGMGVDILAAWDLNDFFFANVHGLFNNHLGNTDRWHLFYGPGAFVGVRDRGAENDIVGLGISGTAGISVVAGPIEFYGRVTQRLELIERTNVDIGGGLGIRAFF